MSRTNLPNYLRTYRKRAGFSQDELAFLLGCQDGALVSRYERFARIPCIETFIACEILFSAPARKLFAGLYDDIERDITPRVQSLIDRLSQAKDNPATQRKVTILRALLAASSHQSAQPL